MSDAPEPSETPGGIGRHAARTACRLLAAALGPLLIASSAGAQQPGPRPIDSLSPDQAEFLPRTTFQLAGTWLTGGDPRFTWDARYGGSADVLDYTFGRLSIVGDYQAGVGTERKNFDVNQGLYI